ncbi:NAD(P)-binding domain-containing protein [Oceaniglobus indicus]|uniref:NAD(P)-binding domain-containing protein n=1 Tax=Oceaniglobus indicus TaxID=2047749 RepID=UPI0013042226|nr:NAD(P)-binding domain-containing protein [Oceaniglobus indicus]
MKIGFVGTGDIAEAIIKGLMRADFPVDKIAVSARSRAISSELAETYEKVTVYEDNQDVVDAGSDLVFLAVLPHQAEEVLRPLRFHDGQEVASVIGTLPVETIADLTGATGSITRAVPLPPVADLRAVTVLSGPSERLEAMFEKLGGVIVTQSFDELNALTIPTTLMGTFFGLQEIVVDWMGQKGVGEADARKFVSNLFLSLARTGVESGQTFPELRKAHSTPGGLNAQIFDVFVENGGDKALTKAMDSVMGRILAASDKA